ncbi:sulfatase-like hydrolase/transferase [Nioella aestuarii]|uniref:sulfatase-like hydrolase/transferase n=1 Tax=Nioella aestuarii TaxID=1662864 RepID=UPI003D7FD4DC
MNTLFLMVDEMAWWAVGSASSLGAKTPHIDALAARGMVFDAAYTPSPICVPARAAIATGRYVHETGHWSSAEPYDGVLPSWGHRLREGGVEAVSIGKLHFRNEGDDTGFERQIQPLHVHEGKGWLLGLVRRPVPRYDATAGLAEELGAGWTGYTRYDLGVTEAACAWLAEPERKARPWAAFVSYLSPHYPLIAPEEFLSLYDPADYVRPAEEVPDHPILREIAGFFAHDRHFMDEARGLAHAAYRGLCSFVDAEVGKVLAALEASGQADDTLVIFTSDHGDMMGEKGFWTKSVMYEASTRVPLIMAGPGVMAGRRADPVSLIDIAPTLADVMGLGTNGFSGRSLLGSPDPDRVVLSEYHDGGCSVGMTMLRWQARNGMQWKYVHYAEGHWPQLFDLTADPGETDDLAKARPEILLFAEKRLAQIMDVEAVNARAHADQAQKVQLHGGRDAILGIPQWNFTKVGET